MILKLPKVELKNVIRIQAVPDYVKGDLIIYVFFEDENGELLRCEIPKEEFISSFSITNDNETRFSLYDND